MLKLTYRAIKICETIKEYALIRPQHSQKVFGNLSSISTDKLLAVVRTSDSSETISEASHDVTMDVAPEEASEVSSYRYRSTWSNIFKYLWGVQGSRYKDNDGIKPNIVKQVVGNCTPSQNCSSPENCQLCCRAVLSRSRMELIKKTGWEPEMVESMKETSESGT